MTPALQSHATLSLCRLAPVIPVLVVDEIRHAAPLARALVRGGLPVLEVTLRTPAALEAIAEMARVPGARVGAGTVLSASDAARARAAGAQFAVSPGATDALVSAGGRPPREALRRPLPQALICPTGGITEASAPAWLNLQNVVCVGGSWVAPGAMVRAGDWAGIERLARAAAALPRGD